MLKVTALTSGKHVPSSRFRVRQFIKPLASLGIQVSEYPLIIKKYTPGISPMINAFSDILKMFARAPGLLAAKSSDVTWLERELVPRRYTFERFAGPKRLFDVDDAIWLTDESRFSEEIAKHSTGVIAGNQFIADYYHKLGVRVWVVPTSVDTESWKPELKKKRNGWTVGWIGSSSNLKYLYAIEESMADFLAEHRTSELLVVCDRKPSFKIILPTAWKFARWTPENELKLTQKIDVGLMPLPETAWSRGKWALKMLLYMAVGLPVIASPVGVNSEILRQAEIGLPAVNKDNWYEALRLLFADRKRAFSLGRAGRRLVEEQYSVKQNVCKLAQIIGEAACS